MAQDLSELHQKLHKVLYDETKVWSPVFKIIEKNIGIERQFIVIGFGVFLLLWLIFGYAGQLLSNIVGTAYPAYASMHAIETTNPTDDTKWLTYWVVFSFFSIVEYFAAIIVGWFPLYWLAKCAFLVWLMIPVSFNGSLVIYNSIIKPYFLQYHGIVDDALDKAQKSANEALDAAKVK
ncbi:hypothetical protein PPYR_00622 [Photinus pyralis]|uniref:Receptor expression-enhancing protein n=1 Tax=Photinus pyralis TaxID=7054 RepID=A0A1Y1MJT7_PHOPY|nr:receptor expression-enhancing protein 5-like [Photinus pyralis]XP_031329367.1 receptor expression-enhancing protein 5-like [Photinus pyralis]KAB0803652.1 hypothetical protein PPYR_00622 [Photinus pyralis]